MGLTVVLNVTVLADMPRKSTYRSRLSLTQSVLSLKLRV